MASGTVLKPTESTAFSSTISTGTSNLQALNGSILKIGKLVIISARIKVVNTIADAMNVPFVFCPYTPKQISVMLPSIVNIQNTGYVYSGLVQLKQFGNSYYACQSVTGNLTADAEVDMFFAYETDD